jgi:hypothetical protein
MTNGARPGLYIRSGSASIPLLISLSPAKISRTIDRSTYIPCLFAVRHLNRVVNREEDRRFHYILLRSQAFENADVVMLIVDTAVRLVKLRCVFYLASWIAH